VLLAPRGTVVLDGTVPDQVKDSTFGTRTVIGRIQPGELRWLEHPNGTIDGIRIFGSDGRLYQMWVYGASSGRGPVRGCWPQRHGHIAGGFLKPAPFLTTVVRIGYVWGSHVPGVVTGRYGSAVRELTVKPGLHSAYLSVSGTARGIAVTGVSGQALCV